MADCAGCVDRENEDRLYGTETFPTHCVGYLKASFSSASLLARAFGSLSPNWP